MIDLITLFSYGCVAACRRTQGKVQRGYCGALSIFPRVDAVECNIRPVFLQASALEMLAEVHAALTAGHQGDEENWP